MTEDEKNIFDALKKAASLQFLAKNKVENTDYTTWKGQEIVRFQEDFFEKVKGSFSEKWFYSYFKNQPKKLPRIDMLNLVSEYAGYQNWAHFKEVFQKSDEEILPTAIQKNTQIEKEQVAFPKKINIFWKTHKNTFVGAISTIIISVCSFLGYNYLNNNSIQFCFVDETTNELIKEKVQITVFQKGQSPIHYYVKNACFNWESQDDTIKMIVKTPYHQEDTIVRNIRDKNQENIKLTTDDYALMIHYFSTSNIKDWKKRRDYIRSAIDNDAVIYQVYDEQGIEIYNKEEFINKMTLATNSLKNINIIDIQYNKKRKISKLRFKTTQ